MAMNVGGRSQATINVTPMIDVLLVLLIIFMVVVNSDAVGLDARVPEQSKEKGDANPQDIVIIVHDVAVSLNQDEVQDADLEGRLTQVFRTRGDHLIFIGAEADLDFERVVHVMDVARGVGLNHIAMLPHQPSNL
ncbi:MAG: biopolymer transporter ExbD [Bryobacteraceae bacterium]